MMSTQASTAAFDKSPQSQSRGITLDLGFSTFQLTLDPGGTPSSSSSSSSSSSAAAAAAAAATSSEQEQVVQVTLVDCPGHASLIRTIIGGAHIIDLMLLVVDATKGIQTQTAEV